MKINVIFCSSCCDELDFSSKTTVVIDVLRASTVIATAINNGVREIIPVGSIDFAVKISGNSPSKQTLLAGERNTNIIDGFNLGNSPFEYSREVVEGKSIVYFTSNGTKAIVKAKYSDKLFVVGFVNISAVANAIKDESSIEILCSGSSGSFCIEDTVCAGLLIEKLFGLIDEIELTDSAKSSKILYEKYRENIHEMLVNSDHGKLLIQNGYEQDVKFCSLVDEFSVVPVFNNGILKNNFNS